ncbi:MAG TPA: M23 family metallopeptidase [Longimicrobiales bacterium]|nr:M23 family metallopeptidase [Longimicrobiales bacterium]
MSDPEGFDLILVPRDGGESRTWHVGRGRKRRLAFGFAVVSAVVVGLLGTWFWVAGTAARVPGLLAKIDSLEAEQARVAELATQLENLEQRYGRVRDLFGARPTQPSNLWVPPTGTGSVARRIDPEPSSPESWPLSEAGFVTRPLLEDAPAEHPGLDIAVPQGTWIRASGAGVVLDVGQDPVYGEFVTLDHGDGLVTLYGHASRTFVERGQQVRRDEVIALSGNTGRSTAPHLHFEIRREGEALDPTTFVTPPN